MQQIGSVALRSSVYVLPHTPQAREDFEWLKGEIQAANGQASIMAADALTVEEDEAIQNLFVQARALEYEALAAAVQKASKTATAARGLQARQSAERELRRFRTELDRIDALDFHAEAPRRAVVEALEALAARVSASPITRTAMAPSSSVQKPQALNGRVWVTRPRPAVDRMASAWLIRRFIDPKARFTFADVGAGRVPSRQLPFDMFGADFGHHGDLCTFETLCRRFAISDPAVSRIAEIVHDIDLKDERYGAAEAPVVARLVEGLRETYKDDAELLGHGMALFAGLYRSFARSSRPPSRPVRAMRPSVRARRKT